MQYTITGKVVKGDRYGMKLGFPTVNLETKIDRQKDFPRDGVYAGIGTLDSKIYKAGIVIGPGEKVEAHLIGYNGDAYGEYVTLETIKFLREYKIFNTEAELIQQIKRDIESCK